MSETFENTDEILADDAIGQTSDETVADEVLEDGGDGSSSKKGRKLAFNIYDAMMLVSLICCTLATLLMFMELLNFGNPVDGFPWRTAEFEIQVNE